MKRITIPTGKRLAIDPITRTLFVENFESPVVSSPWFVTSPTLTNWVRATQGYGATSHGIDHKNSGNWVDSDPNNNQAYNFNYTNSGLTTAEGVIGALKIGYKYTIEFNLQYDKGVTGLNGATTGTGSAKPGDALTVNLCAYHPGDARNDVRFVPEHLLVAMTRTVPDDETWHHYHSEYITSPITDAGREGLDLTVVIDGRTAGCVIDNIKVTEVYNG